MLLSTNLLCWFLDLLKLPNVFVQFAKLFKKLHTLHSSSISTNDCSLLMRLIFVQIAECICFNWKNVFFQFAKLFQQSTHFATPPFTNHCSTNFFRKHSALIEKFTFAKENSNFMPKIKVLCIVLAGVDFGMSYDVSANMVSLFLQQFKHRQKQSHSLIMTMMVIIIVMRS